MSKDLNGAYVEQDGKLYQVIYNNGGQFSYGLRSVEERKCENCGHGIGYEYHDVIESSMLWDEYKPVKTKPTT